MHGIFFLLNSIFFLFSYKIELDHLIDQLSPLNMAQNRLNNKFMVPTRHFLYSGYRSSFSALNLLATFGIIFFIFVNFEFPFHIISSVVYFFKPRPQMESQLWFFDINVSFSLPLMALSNEYIGCKIYRYLA